MDLTPPGAPAEGHIYLNDPTGEIITYYKDSKAATSKKPGGEIVAFATAEGLISYLASKPSLQKSANALSQTEMGIITDMAHSYGLNPTIDYIGPKATGTPFVVILDKSGKRQFTIRKLANKFFLYKIVYQPNVQYSGDFGGTAEGVLTSAEWNKLVKEMHVQFATFAQPTMTKPDADENKLSMSEMKAITDLAGKYMLGTTQPIVTAIDHPSLIIQGNMGSNIWEVRKAKGRYEVFNIINPKHLENVIDEPTFAEMLLKLHKLFEKYMTTPQAPEKMGEFEFSPKEASDIGQIASQFQLLTKGTTMTLEPDKHQVAGIEILNPDGKVAFHLHKDGGIYRIYKVFDGATKTWDLWYESKDAASFFQKLVFYLHGHTPGEPQLEEHNGITPEDYAEIREAVDSYGETFWTEYVKASHGQTAYVEIVSKPDPSQPGTIIFSVGALGNIYQINGPDNKPIVNSPTLSGIIARLHDKLSEKAGQMQVSSAKLSEIVDLVTGAGFDYEPPAGDDPYTFVNNNDIIQVNAYGAVKYTFGGLFGPIYTKTSQSFINWFKNTYMAGKVPSNGIKFATNIVGVLNSAGFLNKDTGQVIPHQKVNAIKAVRFYIMGITGGPCSLSKTKWAVENLKFFLDHIKAKGLPNMDPDAPDLHMQIQEPPHTVSVDNKLTGEETINVEAIVSKHSPAITYQPSGDAIVIWIGNHLTSYKVAKEQDVYRIYTDKDGEWVIQNQVNTYPELAAYLEDMLAHIAKALANSKLEQPLVKTEPSALFPDMLSPSEVAEVKKLVKKFKLPIATTYSKKLMEAKDGPKENNAYNLVISDIDHNVWIKINKAQGKYIISKGLKDAYFPLKKFDHFDYLLAYLDYFLNSYIKEEPLEMEKISDEEVALLKDLVKKYKVKGKVRRKYMTAKGSAKVPYVVIELDDVGMKDYVVGKTAKGVYKLFEIGIQTGDWKNIAITDSWDGMYDIVGKILNDEPIPDESEKYNPPVLNTDQFEWLETFMKTHKPGVEVKVWGNKVIGGYDPSNKISGESNPLFVIRFAPSGNGKIILQVQTEDGGMAADEYPFNTFEGLSEFIVVNLEVVTQLLKSETAPESKLAAVINKAGFDYIDHKEIAQDAGGIKSGTIYENDKSERLYLYDDGMSRIWYKNQADGETYKKEFGNIPELVSWMETHYAGKSSEELTKIKEYLAYLGFTTESKSDKWTTMWTKEVGTSSDAVQLHTDGSSKVTPAPLLSTSSPHSSAFFFNTYEALRQYLSDKNVKGKNWINAYFNQVLVEGKFQKIADQLCEMGFKWVTNKLIVVPFPSGGTMQTTTGVEPKLNFSFNDTYDLAKQVELFLDGNMTQKGDWSTGDDTLDYWIQETGFHYQGEEDTPDHGKKLVFRDVFGTNLYFYVNDKSSSLQFPPSSPNAQKGIGFTTIEDLKSHLETYADKPKDATDSFAKNAGYVGLMKTIVAYEFKQTEFKNAPDEQPYKIFKRPDGAMVNIWGTGVCAYKAPSDKAEWQYSKSFAELDDKLKKMYDEVTTTSEYPSILKYDPETQDLITKDLASLNAPAGMGSIDSIHFQYNNQPTGQGEVRVVGGNVLKFAIGKKIVGSNVLWYVRQKVSDSPNGLYRVYTFVEHHKDDMVKWIKDNIESLTTHKTVTDFEGKKLGSAEGPTVGVVPKKSTTDVETGEQFVPSGETYKAHDIAGNAELIWLNEHDGALLQSLGFVPVPAENRYYKSQAGNIVKFFDTGKAEYVDYFGHPDKPENGEVVEFDNIPHVLKFMVAKHNSFPFSVHNYKSDDGTNVQEIPLNQHDNDMLKQLGFEWGVKGQKYVKLIGPNDTPKIQESKKKKEDPYQMGLPFGGPLHPDKSAPSPNNPGEIPPNDDWEDYSEVFTAYDTGNAIWQSVKGDGPDEAIMNQKEGTIANVLQFIWKRWQHQLQAGLMGTITAKGLHPPEPPKLIIPQKFLNIQGIEVPPNLHDKFIKHGFIYETSLKGYYKSYQENPGMMWTLVKWDGNTYFVSFPHKHKNGKVEHKDFTAVDFYLVMNTIKKVENAEFGNIVQSDEEALAIGDANYFNAPNGWTSYAPYSPKPHPNNIKPEAWIDKELGGYGFEWAENSNMYWWKDENGSINMGGFWQAVRFDKNGTIIYFYPGNIGSGEIGLRYRVSKDFNQIQLKIEMVNSGLAHQQVADQSKLFHPKNYPEPPPNPTSADYTVGKWIKLMPQDHKAVLTAGFKYLMNASRYLNNSGDEFKVADNGLVWYKMDGVGTGWTTVEHFFNMLKSKYGSLESGGQSLTGYEVVQIKDKMEKLGFEEKPQKTAPEDLYFVRTPSDLASKTMMKIHEMVVIFPNHAMTFYLVEDKNEKFLGSFEFNSSAYGIGVLGGIGTGGIGLHLADDLSSELLSHGFTYIPKNGRYECNFGTGGVVVSLTFYGNGQAWAHLLKPDPSTSNGMEAAKEKLFTSFYEAILWAAHKNFEEIKPQPQVPVDEKEVKTVMKHLGLKDQGNMHDGTLAFKSSMGKVIYVDPKTGKVSYNFQYVANDATGELLWGQSVFYNWEVFMDFLKGTTQVKPNKGKLPFTPHPATKGLPKIPPPGQGPPIQGKIQGKVQMPFSGFDYEGWAKGTEHDPKATIKLMPADDKLMMAMGWGIMQTEDDTYYYIKGKTGDMVYFFVDGHVKLIPKSQSPIILPKVKMALDMIWAEYSNAGGTLPTPKAPSTPKQGPDVVVELANYGFFVTSTSSSPILEFAKHTPGAEYTIEWNSSNDTIAFTWKDNKTNIMVQNWTENSSAGIARLKQIFAKDVNVIVALNKLGLFSTVSSGNAITFEKKTPELKHVVRWDKSDHTLDYTASKTDDPSVVTVAWVEDVNMGLAMLEHIFMPKLTEQEFVVEKMEELGFNPVGGKLPKGAQSNAITFQRLNKTFLYDVIYHVEQKMMEYIKSTAKLEKGYHKIVEQWTLNVSDALGKLEKLFAFAKYEKKPSKKTKMLKLLKKKKLLAGTKDMPWSGIDYTKYIWKNMPDNNGMVLNAPDEQTMEKMGWKRVPYKHGGFAYQHDNELMIFYKLGHVGYISDVNKGTVTQSWTNPEDAVRWLWKNKGSVKKPSATGEMPWSGANYDYSKTAELQGTQPVYTTISLLSLEEETLKKMGFLRMQKGNVGWYEKSGSGQYVQFFADGHASMTDKITGTEMEYFDTVKECLEFLWKKYMPFIEEGTINDLVALITSRPLSWL